MTVLEVIQSAAGYLAKNGVEDARLNAEHLLAHALGKTKRLDLYLEFDRPLSDAERAPLRDLVRARSQGTPLQHLLGTAEFLGRSFLCDTRALIPRPETEQLVELVRPLVPATGGRLLDVGTGSGVIAISLALEHPAATVLATDISPAALALAAENATRLSANLTLVPADLLPAGQAPFDLIVANLPYIPSAEIPALAREVQRDPHSALDGGPDGLQLIRRLALLAPTHLSPGGHLALEIGHDQASHVTELLASAGFESISLHRDYPGVERFITALRPL